MTCWTTPVSPASPVLFRPSIKIESVPCAPAPVSPVYFTHRTQDFSYDLCIYYFIHFLSLLRCSDYDKTGDTGGGGNNALRFLVHGPEQTGETGGNYVVTPLEYMS